MCTIPLWPGTWGPGWLPLFETQLIKMLSNAITADSHSCSRSVCSPFMSLLFHHYVTLKYEVWRCFFLFFPAIISRYWRQSLTETHAEEEPRIAVPVSKTTDIFLLLQHVCASVITWFISYRMPKHTITQHWVFRNTVLYQAFIVKKEKKNQDARFKWWCSWQYAFTNWTMMAKRK